jgi:hypothetical protein
LYLAEKCVVEATIKEKMVQNTFTDMVDNETMEGPLLLPALVGGGGGIVKDRRERAADPPWTRVCQTRKPIMILFRRSPNWNKSWQLQGPLWKSTRLRLNSWKRISRPKKTW